MCNYEELFSQLKRALESLKQRDPFVIDRELESVRKHIEEAGEYPELLGEWNLLMSMRWFMEPEKAIPYLEKARDLIGGHSKIVPRATIFYTEVYGPLFMFLRVPGTADETGRKLTQMLDLYEGLCDNVSRWDHMYDVQLAYYRGEFEKASHLLLKAEGSAKKCGDLMAQICAAEYKAYLAVHLREPVMWNQAFNFVCSLHGNENRTIRETVSCIKSRIRMHVGLMTGIPKWIQNGKFGAISDEGTFRIMDDKVTVTAFPIAWLTYIQYLLYGADFYRVINGADIASTLYGLNRMVLYDAYLLLYKASAWSAMGDSEKLVRYLQRAYDRLAADGLWLVGAEFFPAIGDHILAELGPVGAGVMERYRQFSETYPVKLAVIRKIVTEMVFKEPLTEKEQVVARLAAMGYKNEEVGQQLSISSNTVKYHLANVYRKLGIKNRLELKNEMEMLMKNELAYWADIHGNKT